MYYPIFLDISQINCLIVGGGEVGLRKAKSLLDAGVNELTVIDINNFNSSWSNLSNYNQLVLKKSTFTKQDLHNKKLIFACTGEKEFNSYIASLCKDLGLLCNCITEPQNGNFIVPALAQIKNKEKASLMAAISTEGASPAWSKFLKKELQQWLINHAPMTQFLGKLRPFVLALGKDTKHNTALFRSIVQSPLRHYLLENNKEKSKQLLKKLLPVSLHQYIEELLHDNI